MSSNYPPGVTGMEDYFQTHTCPSCKEEGVSPGEDCPFCGEYVPDRYDYESTKADEDYDRLKDDGDLADLEADREHGDR